MKKHLFLLLTALSVLFAGCSSDSNPDDNIEIPNTQPTELKAYADEREPQSGITFTAADSWQANIKHTKGTNTRADDDAVWVTLLNAGKPIYSGEKGTYNLEVSLSVNTTGQVREAVITILCKGQRITITIKQEGTTESGETPKHIAVTDIVLDRTAVNLTVGATDQLTATIKPEDATEKSVVWSSSDDKVVSVDAKTGKLSAIKEGKATITATANDNGKTATCSINVLPDDGKANILKKEFIPDDNFRSWIKENVANGNEVYTAAEAATYKEEMYISRYYEDGIKTLKGIEFFTSLEKLVCYDIGLEEADLSANVNLIYLDLGEDNNLKSLDVRNNTKLKHLEFCGSPITSIDISNNLDLEYLCFSGTKVSSIDITNHTKLKELYTYETPLTSLDVSKNIALELWDCGSTKLTSIDVSNNINLEELDIESCGLTSIDLSKNVKLESLYAAENKFTKLDLSKNAKLTYIDCSDNLITSLDLGNNAELNSLNFNNNKLTSIDISKNKELRALSCRENALTSLTFGENNNLGFINCDENKLTELDLSKCPEIGYISCNLNNLKSLDLSNCAGLREVYLIGNELTSITFNNTHNEDSWIGTINCNNNKLKSIDLSKLRAERIYLDNNELETIKLHDGKNISDIYILSLENNKLSQIDISYCTNIYEFNCKGNDNLNKITVYDWFNIQNYPDFQLPPHDITFEYVNIDYRR